jgi:beta-galactosidase
MAGSCNECAATAAVAVRVARSSDLHLPLYAASARGSNPQWRLTFGKCVRILVRPLFDARKRGESGLSPAARSMWGQRMRKTWATHVGLWLVAGVLGCGALLWPASTLQAAEGTAAPKACRSRQVLILDASAPFVSADAADFHGGTNRTPDGSVLGVTTRYLTLDGKPWIPVMGEMHFSRVPEAEWEDEILKMKTAGVNVISSYIIWIHHEEIQGQWDWKGQKDLRHFAELCAKHGILFYPRIGPWAHAEVRNGGFPDWVVKAGPVRQMDPTFMAETKTFYGQIADQLHGLLWKDGGPVIGVQIENEYSGRGPGKGEAYILALKKLAIAAGLDVPLYTVTGWGNAVVPPHEFLPVYGGYPSAPWDSSREKLAPAEVYAFRFGSRVSGSMGMIAAGATMDSSHAEAIKPDTPFVTAELGGGNEDTYHRRPVLEEDDIAAMMPVMLGSGVNLYGTYMFHGGENPEGKLSTLEESQAEGSATDVPVKSYDFQAPIGDFGVERDSLRLIKNWNYFMRDFGSILAPMPPFAPARLPKSPADLSLLRWSVRTDGTAGFLFVNNYVRQQQMPDRHDVQFAIRVPGQGKAVIPATPLDIPSGAFFAWPFGIDLSGIKIRYATAQLIGKTTVQGKDFVSLGCTLGVRCEVALEGVTWKVPLPQGVTCTKRNGSTIFTWEHPESAGRVFLAVPEPATQSSLQLVLLSPNAAKDTWMVPFEGATRLLETSADVFAGESDVTLEQLGNARFRFGVIPKLSSPPASSVTLTRNAIKDAAANTQDVFSAPVEAFHVAVTATPTRTAGLVPAVGFGPPLSWRPKGVAEAPAEATWDADAAEWSLQLQPVLKQTALPDGVHALFLYVEYVGDEARLMGDGTEVSRLLDDNFFNGMPWEIGLSRFRVDGVLPAISLRILPMRADSPIYLKPAARAALGSSGQAAELRSVVIVPQYELRLSNLGRN